MKPGLVANFVLKSCECFFLNLKNEDSASLLRAKHAFSHYKGSYVLYHYK